MLKYHEKRKDKTHWNLFDTNRKCAVLRSMTKRIINYTPGRVKTLSHQITLLRTWQNKNADCRK